MKNAVLIITSIAALLNASCKKNNGGNDTTPDPTDTITHYAPVETANPNTDYEPAFEGQTRTFGIKTYTDLKVEKLTESLTSPWGIAILPNGKFLITQKAGTIALVSESGTIEKTISGLPAVNSSGQGGLLDIYVDDDFASNRMVYWSYASDESSGTVTALAKGKLSSDESTLESITVLYKANPAYAGTLHYGGRIIMDNQGNLLLSTGDRSDAPMRMHAQNVNNGLGKVLRMTKEGNPAVGNPYKDIADADPMVYSYGHRNVQGLAYDRMNDKIYQSELGPRGGDEINFIEKGKNYGWPIITYGIEYGGGKIGSGITQQSGMEQPLYYWDPVVSPSGMVFYHSNYIPEWQGNLLVACLNGQHIVRLRLRDGKIAGEERLLVSENQRFRDLEIGPDGVLYAITDAGRLYKISKQ